MNPIVNGKFLLEKFHVKGGWTYTRIPKKGIDKNSKSSWVRVRGTIDGYAISHYHLMSIDKQHLFLPIKADIRKYIGKKEGDMVTIILYIDNEPIEVPEELLICLRDAPLALRFFENISDNERKHYIQWIYAAKKTETRVNRITKTINRLSKGLKMYQPTDAI